MEMENLDQAYQDTLDFIYSFIDFSMKRHLDDSHRFFKLDRMRRMMDLLGNPQDKFLSIHVAGTKGKGSTASLCASALRAAGYRVGLYTSPHLQEFTERIQINGCQIDRQSLVNLAARIRPLTEKVPDITTFELTTALAFLFDLGEEIASDAMDLEGDRVRSSRSIAARAGRAFALRLSGVSFSCFIALTFLPFITGWLGPVYLALTVGAAPIMAYLTARLVRSPTIAEGRVFVRRLYLAWGLFVVVFVGASLL